MQINPSAELLDLDDKPIKENDKPVLIGSLIVQALGVPDQADSPELKVKRFDVSLRVHRAAKANEPVDLTVEEAADIKKVVGKHFAPLVVGRIYELLDPPKKQ